LFDVHARALDKKRLYHFLRSVGEDELASVIQQPENVPDQVPFCFVSLTCDHQLSQDAVALLLEIFGIYVKYSFGIVVVHHLNHDEGRM
jgi:hypothetical protein